MDNKLLTLINFINKYGYCISRTFNDVDHRLLSYIDDDTRYCEPDSRYFTWTCCFFAQFLDLLFGFNDKDLILKDRNGEHESFVSGFVKEFVPETVFHIVIEGHEFHIFYFGEDNLYLADVGRNNFEFTKIQKVDVIRFIEDPNFLKMFLENPGNKDHRYIPDKLACRSDFITEIQIHKIEYIPSLNDVLNIIKRSHNLQCMIDCFKEECENDEHIEDVINKFNHHMLWLENYISEMDNKLLTLLNFINKYGYCISRTFNDMENHLLIYIGGEGYREPDSKSFSWSCFFSAQFLNLLFGFNKKDLVLKGQENGNLTLESFVKEFVPGTGFFFEVENHQFHIFYFGEDNLYLAHYDADADGYMFNIAPIQKVDMIRFITDPTFRSVFLYVPEPEDCRYKTVKQLFPIFEIQVHKIEYIPSLNDLLNIIKQSHNLKCMIEHFEEYENETAENVVDVFNQHMSWLENYISST